MILTKFWGNLWQTLGRGEFMKLPAHPDQGFDIPGGWWTLPLSLQRKGLDLHFPPS